MLDASLKFAAGNLGKEVDNLSKSSFYAKIVNNTAHILNISIMSLPSVTELLDMISLK